MPVGPRLFFALWPDDATRAALHRAVRATVRRAGGKPVPPRNYHMTLAFLGPVPAAAVPGLAAEAARLAMPALRLRLARYGYWPASRTFWIGPAAPVPELVRFVGRLGDMLERLGLPPDRKAFIPHVTLARKVSRPPADPAPVAVDWRVGGIALVASTPDEAHSRYEILQTFPPGSSPEP